MNSTSDVCIFLPFNADYNLITRLSGKASAEPTNALQQSHGPRIPHSVAKADEVVFFPCKLAYNYKVQINDKFNSIPNILSTSSYSPTYVYAGKATAVVLQSSIYMIFLW
nr:hypothetical protein HmN_000699300 [Hymenolepis microstoma]